MRNTSSWQCFFKLSLLLSGVGFLSACSSLSSQTTTTGFTLSTPGRTDNAMLTRPYAGKNPKNPNCLGENITPALSWVHAPAGTRSFAIVMDDQAGRAGLGVSHWVAYGLAPTVSELAEGEASAPSSKLVMGKNTLDMSGYLGPCPPRGNAPQHYVYTLIATSIAPDALPPGLNKAELMSALQGKALGAASLVLRYAH